MALEEIELRLWILWISGREYQASILRSPFGLGSHRFVVPESSPLWADEEAGSSEAARDVRRRAGAAELSPLHLLQLQGRELCGLIFAGENREPFKRCCEAARERQVWLRFRLTFQNSPAAADWPWEALVADWTGKFLVDQVPVSFERQVGLRQESAPPPAAAADQLQILAVTASPEGLTRLDVLREKSLIAKALRKAGVAFKIVTANSRATLDKAAARKAPFDIIHIAGHGDFAENEGAIWLQDLRREGKRVSSRELPSFLRRSAALVVLNACHSGRGARDPFAGLAEALILAGNAAVVAMRRPISDDGALALAEELYAQLAAGETVGHALAKWRETSSRNDADWAVPVLYLAGDDFALTMPRAAVATPPPEPPQRPRTGRWAILAALLLTAGASAYRLSPAVPPPPCPAPPLASDPRCPLFPGLDLPLAYIEDSSGAFPAFCIGKFEVTRGQYAQVRRSLAPSAGEAWLPQEDVGWTDGRTFAEALAKLAPAANCYLPSDAQWEFAARAGGTASDLAASRGGANCQGDGDGFAEAACVGSFEANAWGLFDLRGNVWEWTQDSGRGGRRIRRGGSYKTVPDNCRLDKRTEVQIDRKQEAAGFRLACDPLILDMK